MDIILKRIQAILIYNVLREGVPKLNGTWKKITSVMRVRQGMLFSSNYMFTRIRYICLLVYPKTRLRHLYASWVYFRVYLIIFKMM